MVWGGLLFLQRGGEQLEVIRPVGDGDFLYVSNRYGLLLENLQRCIRSGMATPAGRPGLEGGGINGKFLPQAIQNDCTVVIALVVLVIKAFDAFKYAVRATYTQLCQARGINAVIRGKTWTHAFGECAIYV